MYDKKRYCKREAKKWYIDLMFTNIDESFIQWVGNLETHCA